MKRTLVFSLIITICILSYTTSQEWIHKENDESTEAFEIVLYSNNEQEGYRDRYITFEFPQVKNGMILFYCAEKGCKYMIQHKGNIKVHEIHVDENLNILKND